MAVASRVDLNANVADPWQFRNRLIGGLRYLLLEPAAGPGWDAYFALLGRTGLIGSFGRTLGFLCWLFSGFQCSRITTGVADNPVCHVVSHQQFMDLVAQVNLSELGK